MLRVYDTNCRRSHSCAIFKDPHIIIRELCYREIFWALDTTFIETYLNVLTTAIIVRIWVFWDVMLCHSVSSSCRFGGSCYLQIVGNQPCRHTALTAWKTWILINTTLRMLDVRSHNVASPHVACTFQVTLCYMHWIVLTHLLVDIDQCPYDFHVASPFKNDQIWVRWSQKGAAVILAEVPGVCLGGNPWASVSMECWSQF